MSWTQRGVLIVLAGLAGMIVMSRVGGSKKAGVPSGKSPMKGAVFAAAIPVYPGARLSDVMGGEYRGDLGGPAAFTSQSWFFSIPDPAPKVVEYYRRSLPEGARPTEAEEGEVAFEWIPPGAAEGERVHVTIRKDQLQIGEVVKARGNQ